MRVVRSATRTAGSSRIDAAAARALPGVVAVWTAADIADLPPIDFREGRTELEPYRQPVLARQVRYVGEPVAAVFATDPYLAEDAADLVDVEIEELPSCSPPTPRRRVRARPRHRADVIRKGYGDVDAALRAAPIVVELDLAIGRHSGVPLETRGAIGRYDARATCWSCTAPPRCRTAIRELLARMLGRARRVVHLYEAHVGGGFGIRGELYPEDVLVCVAAMRLGRPVKWIEDRREHLIAANHSRQQRHRIRAAVDAEGRILAIDDSSSTTRAPTCAPTARASRT